MEEGKGRDRREGLLRILARRGQETLGQWRSFALQTDRALHVGSEEMEEVKGEEGAKDAREDANRLETPRLHDRAVTTLFLGVMPSFFPFGISSFTRPQLV